METVQKDTGLQCLALLLRFHEIAVEPAQIAHQFSGAEIGVSEMLRCAKDLKLKARVVTGKPRQKKCAGPQERS